MYRYRNQLIVDLILKLCCWSPFYRSWWCHDSTDLLKKNTVKPTWLGWRILGNETSMAIWGRRSAVWIELWGWSLSTQWSFIEWLVVLPRRGNTKRRLINDSSLWTQTFVSWSSANWSSLFCLLEHFLPFGFGCWAWGVKAVEGRRLSEIRIHLHEFSRSHTNQRVDSALIG